LKCLASLPNLVYLSMSYLANVSDTALEALASRGKLRKLMCRGCPSFTDVGCIRYLQHFFRIDVLMCTCLLLHTSCALKYSICSPIISPWTFWKSCNFDWEVFNPLKIKWLIPVAAQSMAWVCSHLLARIVGSNPAGGTDVLSVVIVVCCQVGFSASG
jgi:hypothetical protein